MITLSNVYGDDKDLAEIFQSMDIKFAFVNKDYQQVHQPCKCRDFLGDMIWSRKTGQLVKIYGLAYDFAEHPYDTEVTRFSLKFPNRDQLDNFIKNINYLHKREKAYKIPSLTKILETDKNLTIVIESDKVWQSHGWKLSLFTFYIKLMGYEDPLKPKSPESGYLTALTPEKEHEFLSNIFLDVDDLHKELYYSHNYSGFYTAIQSPGYSKIASHIFTGTVTPPVDLDSEDGEFDDVYYAGDEDDDDECYDDEEEF